MNTIEHYFGAFLDIKTRLVTTTEIQSRCANGHKAGDWNYCPKCGGKVSAVPVEIITNPTFVYELIDEEIDDEQPLQTVTPPSLYGKKIIAISDDDAGSWFSVNRKECGFDEILEFPTDAEVDELKSALAKACDKSIAAIQQHPAVVSVTIRAGYVRIEEY